MANVLILVPDQDFYHPIAYRDLDSKDFDAMILPGGHARGMREYLESSLLQFIVTESFARNQPIGAICHGVLLAARDLIEATGGQFSMEKRRLLSPSLWN
jgi:protease I